MDSRVSKPVVPIDHTSVEQFAADVKNYLSLTPRQLPSRPPPNWANPTAGANSGLDKTWGQGHRHFEDAELDQLVGNSKSSTVAATIERRDLRRTIPKG